MDEKEGSASEFQDWEFLHEFDESFPQLHSSDSNSRVFHGIEGDSGSETTIRFDYFSLDNHETNAKTALELENLNSNDTNSENRSCRKSASELGFVLNDGLLDDYELNQSHTEITKTVTGFEEITTDVENLEIREEVGDGKLSGSSYVARDESLSAKDIYSPMESEESGEESESQDEVLDDSCSNSIGNESVAMKSGDDDHVDTANDVLDKDLGGEDGDSSEKTNLVIEEVKIEAKSGEVEAQMKKVVWWKVPFQVLRYFLLRASPAWSFSVAVAFMGMVILGRRLYKMNRKSKSLRLNIAVDDKKASQFSDRAARLNEAFSLVRRVPVVRASLAGANSWPAMSILR